MNDTTTQAAPAAPVTPSQPDVRTKAILQAVRLLNAASAQYAIIAPNGERFGTLEIVPPKVHKPRTRGPSAFPVGAIRAYYKPLIENMQPADVVRVPFAQFTGEAIRGGVSAYACSTWGNGSVMTNIVEAERVVEVMRLG